MLSSFSPYSFFAMSMRPPTFKRLLGNLLHHQLNLILHTLVSQHIDRLCGHADAPKGLRPDTLHELDFLTAEFLFDLGLTAAAIEVDDFEIGRLHGIGSAAAQLFHRHIHPVLVAHVFSCS